MDIEKRFGDNGAYRTQWHVFIKPSTQVSVTHKEEEVDDFKKVQVIDDSKEAVSIGTMYLSTLRCCANMHRLCTISNQMGSSIDRSK